MSAIVLAGGKSRRMGTDKAFLRYGRRTFISLISEQLLGISDDVIVAIGKKDKLKFESELPSDRRLHLINDSPYLDNPLGGMLSALERVTHEYAFVTACDSPLLNLDVARHLYNVARSHSAAVPVWEEDDVMTSEPLVAVYNVQETKNAISDAVRRNMMGCKRMLSLLPDARYVSVQELRDLDPALSSLLNINEMQDYRRLEEYADFYSLLRSMSAPKMGGDDAASRGIPAISGSPYSLIQDQRLSGDSGAEG